MCYYVFILSSISLSDYIRQSLLIIVGMKTHNDILKTHNDILTNVLKIKLIGISKPSQMQRLWWDNRQFYMVLFCINGHLAIRILDIYHNFARVVVFHSGTGKFMASLVVTLETPLSKHVRKSTGFL